MKKTIAAIFTVILMVGIMSGSSFANNVELVINNKVINEGVKPIQQQGTTLVPLRVVSSNLGAEVDYNTAKKIITINRESIKISLEIGNMQATLNGKKSIMSMAPKIINGTTYVPIRFVSENLNCYVNWNPDISTVEISDKANNGQFSNAEMAVVKDVIPDNKEELQVKFVTPYSEASFILIRIENKAIVILRGLSSSNRDEMYKYFNTNNVTKIDSIIDLNLNYS